MHHLIFINAVVYLFRISTHEIEEYDDDQTGSS